VSIFLFTLQSRNLEETRGQHGTAYRSKTKGHGVVYIIGTFQESICRKIRLNDIVATAIPFP